jgi:hypothetical protein
VSLKEKNLVRDRYAAIRVDATIITAPYVTVAVTDQIVISIATYNFMKIDLDRSLSTRIKSKRMTGYFLSFRHTT